jgi:hypothetical protein
MAAPALVALAAVAACALQTAIYGPPIPAVHDEFSYLLAADTYSRGRCTNPTPPLWEHFETLQELMVPTYASKYPPGQGLFLAVGKLFGHAVVGVWLGVALACGAGCWMLRAFVPRWWAVAGGLMMVSRLGLGKWGWNYWGGSVAFAGGALFIGGWLQLLRKPRATPAVAMAIGLSLLAVSRPYEGLLLCVPVGLATLWRAFRRVRPSVLFVLRKTYAPTLVVLLPAALALGYYNYRVTGNALRMPYAEYSAQYDAVPPLLFMSEKPAPAFRHKEFAEYEWNYQHYYYDLQRKDLLAWWKHCLFKVRAWRDFFLGYGLTLPLVVLPCVLLKSSRTRVATLTAGFVLGMVGTTQLFGMEHYVAPAAPLLYVLVVQCLRYVALVRWGGVPIGRTPALAWLVGCLLVPVPTLFPQLREPLAVLTTGDAAADTLRPMSAWLHRELWDWLVHPQPWDWAVRRMQMERALKGKGGRHLVLVEYGPGHSVHEEWVYNEADIEAATVVWARPMSREGWQRLARRFADRTIWLLYVTDHANDLRRLRAPHPGETQ